MKDQKTLTRDEMKNVIGWVAAPAFNCQCTGSVGTWTGHYSSYFECDTVHNLFK